MTWHDVTYRRAADGSWEVWGPDRKTFYGTVYRVSYSTWWARDADDQRIGGAWGRRSSAAQHLAKHAEREPMHRGGAK